MIDFSIIKGPEDSIGRRKFYSDSIREKFIIEENEYIFDFEVDSEGVVVKSSNFIGEAFLNMKHTSLPCIMKKDEIFTFDIISISLNQYSQENNLSFKNQIDSIFEKNKKNEKLLKLIHKITKN